MATATATATATFAGSRHRDRILFLDAYDSFSNNITSLLTTLLDVDVFVLPIDSPLLDPSSPSFWDDFGHELSHYAAVVCGPGPGSPGNPRDVGLMRHLWSLAQEHLLPVLGICLGFQSLVEAASGGSAEVRRLRRALHGMVREIEFEQKEGPAGHGDADDDDDIFDGVGHFRATLYHSLCGDVGQDDVPAADWQLRRFRPFPAAPDLLPLAWVEERRGGTGSGNERVLMAVRHREKPFWGLQYHPESVCTDGEGNKVVLNWFRLAMRWNRSQGRIINRGEDILAAQATKPSLLSQLSQITQITSLPSASTSTQLKLETGEPSWRSYGVGFQYSADTIPLPPNVTVPDIVESLQHVGGATEHVVLDSANASVGEGAADVRGRYSIIALDLPDALRLEHHVGDGYVTASLPRVGHTRTQEVIPLDDFRSHNEDSTHGSSSVWRFLAQFHDDRSIDFDDVSSSPDSPFLGGFMGFITYEHGLSGINVAFPSSNRGHCRPDVCFAWVTRSVVIDHAKKLVRIQHLHPPEIQGQTWIDSTIHSLRSSQRWRHPSGAIESPGSTRRRDSISAPSRILFNALSVSKPAAHEYETKVETCQDYIAAGESYELCLTDQTVVRRSIASESSVKLQQQQQQQQQQQFHDLAMSATIVPVSKRRRRSSANKNRCSTGSSSSGSAWQLFRALRTRQPAPFASYVRLGGATLVSSSPERFLQYDRQGLCSMRPMKGTVRKSAEVPTLREAERILHVPKEEAENLMIVDLVRHDLHGICGPGNVSIRDLMRVEEYRSVFQMTTVVEGQLPLPLPLPLPTVQTQTPTQGGQGEQGEGRRPNKQQQQQQQGQDRYTGLDVLAASLPPGSMTGAPKKRSCEILQQIEDHKERSLYSGVVGYMCVSGRGDWSVTIRSMFRWDDEARGEMEEEAWHIGAGGAVTILSTPVGEREEMFIKLAGPLSIFSTT